MAPAPADPRTARRVYWPWIVAADLMAFGALAMASLLIGLLVNSLHHPPLPLWYHSRAERLHTAVAGLVPAAPAQSVLPATERPREIALDEFQAFALAHRGAVIDARGSSFYREGHVPGALNLSREGFPADYQRLGSRLEAHKADAVVIYCSGADCHDADLVADALASLGYGKLLVYREGWEEWSQSGLPQEQ